MAHTTDLKRKAVRAIIDAMNTPYMEGSGLRIQLERALASKLSVADIGQLEVLVRTSQISQAVRRSFKKRPAGRKAE